ncbi:MAG: SGNH/GDSL hydrolase family protein [Cyanobacteria bacterium SBLK]|nr:SGNH/GDSL hydrolase family protein [Cyanobacteria bacterium SBLK]
MNSLSYLGHSGLITKSNINHLIYELKPNINAYYRLVPFRTNSKGLRDREYQISKSKGIFRVAVIGDSYTMATGVKIDEAYHSLLESKINNEKRKLDYEFINFGVGGYNLKQYMTVIEFKANQYDPDLILIGFCPENDHQIPPEGIFERPYNEPRRTYSFYESFVIKKVTQKFRHDTIKRLSKTSVNEFSEEEKEYMSRLFLKMRDYSQEYDIPIVVVYLSHIYNEIYVKNLRELVESNSLNFIDASLTFKDIPNLNQYLIYLTDSHPNNKANRIFADRIYKYLNAGYFLDK